MDSIYLNTICQETFDGELWSERRYSCFYESLKTLAAIW